MASCYSIPASPRRGAFLPASPTSAPAAAASPRRASSSSSPTSSSSFLSSPIVSTLLSGLLLTSVLPRRAFADDGWITGRSTYYGNDGGATIDQGSCMYGYLPNGMVSTGTDIAALSDTDSGFAGSCGRCYEVQCNPSAFNDGYGNYLDRNWGCISGASVTVTVTDSCPCDYPGNAYSNRRWCCGDMQHIDLSYQAFAKIADLGLGVIGIKYRQVSCPGYSAPSPRAATWDYSQGTGGGQS